MILPKDLLVDLEKGNRVNEMLEVPDNNITQSFIIGQGLNNDFNQFAQQQSFVSASPGSLQFFGQGLASQLIGRF